MQRALALAGRGRGYVEPNPMVGCVIVKAGRVIAEGKGVARPTDFTVARGANFTSAARKSFDYIAERIVEQMQERF